MHNKTFYGIRVKSTKRLARVEIGEYGFATLTDRDDCPVWEVEEAATVARALAENPIHENSSHDRPRWGRFKRDDIEPVIVHVRVEMARVPIVEPVKFTTTIDTRELPPGLARRYAGRDLPKAKRYILVMGTIPEGETRADQDKLVGRIVMFGSIYNFRRVLAVCDPPPEFAPDFKGKPGIFLICAASLEGDPFDLETHYA